MVAGALGWAAEAAATAFLYSTTALLVGAALRLLPMGQLEGQRVLWSLHPVIERVAREAAERPPADLWSFTPGLEIAGMLSRAPRHAAVPVMSRAAPAAQDRHRRAGRLRQDRARGDALRCACGIDYDMAVITNDIYTQEDAQFLIRRGALPAERVVGVETGGCPHTAIREDASVNLEAVHELMGRFPGLELLFVESGGDNLAATFSPELVDATIYVIDVAEGEKIPRKGGPGHHALRPARDQQDRPRAPRRRRPRRDGARRQAHERRPARLSSPISGTGTGVDAVVDWIRRELLFEP